MASRERATLTAIVRTHVAEIARRVAEECARAASANRSLDRALADSLAAEMLEASPVWLAALAASDTDRPELLRQLDAAEYGPRFRSVPPLARVGAVSFGLRLARAAVVEDCSVTGATAEPLVDELDLFERAVVASRNRGLSDTGIA